jgi:hypothetical protein
VCHGFHDAADHNAVGQNIEVIVAPNGSYRSKNRAPQNRAAVGGCGKQFERAVAVGLEAMATAVRVGHGRW